MSGLDRSLQQQERQNQLDFERRREAYDDMSQYIGSSALVLMRLFRVSLMANGPTLSPENQRAINALQAARQGLVVVFAGAPQIRGKAPCSSSSCRDDSRCVWQCVHASRGAKWFFSRLSKKVSVKSKN